jgi:hypothetical protein
VTTAAGLHKRPEAHPVSDIDTLEPFHTTELKRA